MESTSESFAQYGEDLILWRALSFIKRGFYIDIGAMDPDTHSVTKLFYNAGWNGINVEPCPTWVKRLVERRPLDITVPVAVSDRKGMMTFHEVLGTGLSTMVGDFVSGYVANGMTVTSYTVPTDTIEAICARHAKGEIHFMKIDVEGAERSALLGCNFKRFRPWVLAIESTIPCTYTPCHDEWESIVLDAGYQFALFETINRYYVADERSYLIHRFRSNMT